MIELDSRDPGFSRALDRLVRQRQAQTRAIDREVQDIIDAVRNDGDEALLRHAGQFDGVRHDSLVVDDGEISRAIATVPAGLQRDLGIAAARIEAFHRRGLPGDDLCSEAPGLETGVRWTPVDSVALYAPGGKAAYPSSVLMTAIPARLAGCRRRVLATPAPGGRIHPLTLAAARLAGVTEVFRLGGAHAIAALALGTPCVPAVDMIAGPGNAWVAAAKRALSGIVGIDSIAGPSEILVVAGSDARPDWLAADLLAQAEHDENAQAILVTADRELARQVVAAVTRELATAERDVAAKSWHRNGTVILVDDLESGAPPVIDRIAPEHLALAMADEAAQELFGRIRHAGAVFLGHYTPEALGDYVAGPNHVLPTGGTARFSSGLACTDFMKRSTFVRASREGLAMIGPVAMALAAAEGLPMHRRSVALRLGKDE